uniref:Uncharacterized protein n=1 Tax=Panagrolaimus sp. JU765 TaxID=591449 RepID=A0AC34Q046_9BILA
MKLNETSYRELAAIPPNRPFTSYRELAAIPPNRPFVSHINFTDDHGRQITHFPAFRSFDDLDQISRIQSPIKANTVPLVVKNREKYENNYHELVREFGPPKNGPESLFLFGRDEIYRSESIGSSSLKPDRPKTVIEELKAKLGRQHSFSTTKSTTNSSIQRRASESIKNQKMIEDDPLLHQKPISKNLQPLSQTSPDTFVSTSATSSNFSFRKGKRPSVNPNGIPKPESRPSEVSPDILQFLKETPAHVRPHVQNFLFSHFEHPQKQLDHTEWSETEIPMKHYWQKVFKVKDDKKSATINIENLLSIEPEIGPFHGFVPNKSLSSLERMDSSRRISVDSGTLSAESGFNSSPRHVMSSESSPVSSSSEMDLLTLVLKKIRQKKPLEAKLLERDIIDNYRGYQQALEQALVVDELYTKLAYKILHAESYWYAARITSDQTLKHRFYALARHNYSSLLDDAKFNLDADDKSLLTILEKMTQILIESDSIDSEIVAKCRRAVFEAEKALESKPDVKKERKVIKIKGNLSAFK